MEEWGDNINSASAWSGLTNVVDIAAGGHQSLAIMSDGSMKAWNASNGNIIFESAPGAFVLDADIDWDSHDPPLRGRLTGDDADTTRRGTGLQRQLGRM